ncbi:MAG: DNA gyrase C-terminal beta-propeller domain-containing protein, partial [Christensenellaceae bacterium]|nr:DNA gyrase C-terminal beta-propeller domain-containing protein [Christensenellaceae bacterium]
QAILDMRLQRLTGLEILSLKREYEELTKLIDRLEAILKSERKLLDVIKGELAEVKAKYREPRRTALIDQPDQPIVIEEEQPAAEETYVLVTRAGFARRIAPRTWERFVQSGEALEPPLFFFKAETDWKLLFITDAGQCYPLTAAQLPDAKPKDRGLPLAGLLAGLEKDEKLIQLIRLPENAEGNLCCVTEGGLIKRTALGEYAVRKARYAALNLKGSDQLAVAFVERAEESMLLVTYQGMAICFAISEVPITGRATAGVKGIALSPGDKVMAAFTHDAAGEVLIATERGCFKRCLLVDFDPQARGGKGLKCIQFQKNGANGRQLVAALRVTDPIDLVVAQHSGTFTVINSEWVKLELREGRGQPMVVAVLDDVVTDVGVKSV